MGSIASAVGSIAGGFIGSDAARSAGNTLADAANSASATETADSNKAIGAQSNALFPYQSAGVQGLYQLANLLGINPQTLFPGGQGPGGQTPGGTNPMPGMPQAPGPSAGFGSLLQPFSMSQFQQDPGYKFRLDQGSQAINNAASATGMQLSGSNLEALSKFNQGEAAQGYQQAFQNYNTNQNNLYSRLGGFADMGQQAATNVGNFAGNTYNQLGQLVGGNQMARGEALASGTIGQANAWSGAIGNASKALNSGPMGAAMDQQALSSLFGGGGAMAGGSDGMLALGSLALG